MREQDAWMHVARDEEVTVEGPKKRCKQKAEGPQENITKVLPMHCRYVAKFPFFGLQLKSKSLYFLDTQPTNF